MSQMKKLLDSGTGKGLRSFLIQKTLELRDIGNLEEATNEEVKAQLLAYKKLKEILSQIINWQSEEIKREENEFTLPQEYY